MQSSTARNEISLLGAQQSDSTWVFLPSHHHYTLFSLVCSPIWIIPAYQKTAAFQQRELPKESHMHKTTEYFKNSRPPQSAGNCINEMSSRSDVDLMPWTCVGWAPSTDYSLCQQGDSHTTPCYSIQAHCWLFQVLWTATKHWHNGKGSRANWNKACSQSGLGSQPQFYSGSFKTC